MLSGPAKTLLGLGEAEPEAVRGLFYPRWDAHVRVHWERARLCAEACYGLAIEARYERAGEVIPRVIKVTKEGMVPFTTRVQLPPDGRPVVYLGEDARFECLHGFLQRVELGVGKRGRGE